jgi:hypothetical protein
MYLSKMLVARFTALKQSFELMESRMNLNTSFVSNSQDVNMYCRIDLMKSCLGTNDKGFQLPRKVVLLGA